jgi:L-threonylcarbamoyladenylate synthase
METKIIKINNKNLKDQLALPAAILKDGGTVAFPTETVYGLGANALDEKAIKKIFEAKGRPSDNPLIVHIATVEALKPLVKDIDRRTQAVIDHFWPGPLTIILDKSDQVPAAVTAGLNTVAVRMPSNVIANTLIALADVPVAAPSANLSGKPSPTDAKHVILDLEGRVDCIVDGGPCDVGLESTVLDLTDEQPMILRPGGITKEALEVVLGEVKVDQSLEQKSDELMQPKSPGMKYTHYSPEAEVYIIETEKNFDSSGVQAINQLIREKFKDYKVGVMATDEYFDQYSCDVKISLGSRTDMKTIANTLFSTLREFDALGVDIVLSESFESTGIGHAIMNRLKKSAGFKIFKL